MSEPRIFVSYDVEHDGELYDRLVAYSTKVGCAVTSASERPAEGEAWRERARRRIRDADQMIVICGAHTESSESMEDELRIAREVQTPYFLLWGRRESMCTKPRGAKPAEGMYSWTRSILQDQITCIVRRARSDEAAESLRGARGRTER